MARYTRVGKRRRYPRNRSGLSMVFTLIANLLTGVFGTWAIVEFILYLVKDKEFNWTSVWLTGICLALTIFFFVRTFIQDSS